HLLPRPLRIPGERRQPHRDQYLRSRPECGAVAVGEVLGWTDSQPRRPQWRFSALPVLTCGPYAPLRVTENRHLDLWTASLPARQLLTAIQPRSPWSRRPNLAGRSHPVSVERPIIVAAQGSSRT